MKRFIKLFFIVFLAYVAIVGVTMCSQKQEQPQSSPAAPKPPLQIVFYTDMSSSILTNGVEIVSSDIFSPLYECLDRQIQLSFGCIDGHSSGNLITLYLMPFTTAPPLFPELSGKVITERRLLKEEYLKERAKYSSDSTAFFSERYAAIAAFRTRVDSTINTYRTNLASSTDLVRAVQIAGDAFNYLPSPNTRQLLILNTDGLSNTLHQVAFKKNVEVILINANGHHQTILDSITTIKLTDPKQALLHALKQ